MLIVRLFGQFSVTRDGEPVSIPTRNGQALFAFLVLNAGTAYRREYLAGLLWPESAEENARSNLRHELWRLRKALELDGGSPLRVDDLSIAFNTDSPYDLDVRRFEKEPDGDFSTPDLIESLTAYGGELLPGFYNEWVFAERERLEAQYEARMARLLDQLQEERRWPETQAWALRWIAQGRLPEPAYRALITAYANTGDISRATATYERYAQALQDELGVKPSDSTRSLYRKLKSGWNPDTASPAAAEARGPSSIRTGMRIAGSPSVNVPRPLTSFIGRDREIAQVEQLATSARLVTITGSGGVGKTRLAIAMAGVLAARYRDGAWWVELAPLSIAPQGRSIGNPGTMTDVEIVAQAVSKSLRLPETPGETVLESLAGYLEPKQLLLILDNCEHLVEACALLVERLLGAAPEIGVLATSREPLDVPGEKAWDLPSLSLPDLSTPVGPAALSASEAIRLFHARTVDAISGYAPEAAELLTIAEICKRLDGIPLAIELAAARMGFLTAQEIADRLDQRFSLLTSGNRTSLPRHRTLLAAIEWSYDLLDDSERNLLCRLAVFPGTFSLEAVEAICSGDGIPAEDVLGLIGKLVDKSLVQARIGEAAAGTPTRYRILETICSFGRLKLVESGGSERIFRKHAAYFMEFVESVEPLLRLPEQARWYRRLKDETDNIRSAIEWVLRNREPEYGLRIAGALMWFWWSHGSTREGLDLTLRVLAISKDDQPPALRAGAVNAAGFLQWALGNFPAARLLLDEAMELAAVAEDATNMAWSLQLQGLVLTSLEEYALADDAMQASLRLVKQTGDPTKSSFYLAFLGDIPLRQGDIERAVRVYTESSDILRDLGNSLFYGYPQRRLGFIALDRGDLATALHHFLQSLEMNRAGGDQRGVAACLVGFSALERSQGNPALAARLLGASARLLFSDEKNLLHLDQLAADRLQAALLDQMGKAALELEEAHGWSLDEKSVVEMIRNSV